MISKIPIKPIYTLDKKMNLKLDEFLPYFEEVKNEETNFKNKEITLIDLLLITGENFDEIRNIVNTTNLKNKVDIINQLDSYEKTLLNLENKDLFTKIKHVDAKTKKIRATADSKIERIKLLIEKNNLPNSRKLFIDLLTIENEIGLEKYVASLEKTYINFSFEKEKENILYALKNGLEREDGSVRDLDGVDILFMLGLRGEMTVKNLKHYFKPEEIRTIRLKLKGYRLVYAQPQPSKEELMSTSYQINSKPVKKSELNEIKEFIESNNLEFDGFVFNTLLKANYNNLLLNKTNDIFNLREKVKQKVK